MGTCELILCSLLLHGCVVLLHGCVLLLHGYVLIYLRGNILQWKNNINQTSHYWLYSYTVHCTLTAYKTSQYDCAPYSVLH